MERFLDSGAGGPVPASLKQEDNTVFVRLNDPADFDRARSILEATQGPDQRQLFSSVSRSTQLYPAVALFVDLGLLPA